MTTCPKCRQETREAASFCHSCGACLNAPIERPAAQERAREGTGGGMGVSESEARERDAAFDAASNAFMSLTAKKEPFDRRQVMDRARVILGGGLQPYLGAAVDAAMGGEG